MLFGFVRIEKSESVQIEMQYHFDRNLDLILRYYSKLQLMENLPSALPVAAHLTLGVPPEDMGETIDSLLYLPMPQPVKHDGKITGQVIYQDVYGNLVTNIPAESLPAKESIEVRIKGRTIIGLSRTFNDGSHVGEDGLIALTASHGYLEVALPNGSAAELLSVGEGKVVTVVSSSG